MPRKSLEAIAAGDFLEMGKSILKKLE